jgi:DNA-binding transcriptional MerR regulator
MYSTSAFATLAGITVKSLRHCERLGLLTPQRNAAGYRRYSMADLQSLERILALKSLGLPLGAVKTLLKQPDAPQRAHREQLEARRARLDRAIDALKMMEMLPGARGLEAFVRHATWERWEAEREKRASTTIQRAPDRASPSRLALFQQIEAVLDANAATAGVRELARRWRDTIDPDTWAACQRRALWPDGMRRYVASLYDATPERWERVVALVESALTPAP